MQARTLRVEEGASLEARSIALGAREVVQIRSGARITARGRPQGSSRPTLVNDDVSFLALTGATETNLTVLPSASAGVARLELDAGSVLETGGALFVSVPGETRLKGELAVAGANIDLRASRIALGSAPADFRGLSLSAERLASLVAGRLSLHSTSAIQTHGDFTVQVGDLRIRAPGLSGIGAGDRHIHTDRLFIGGTTGSTQGLASYTFAAGSESAPRSLIWRLPEPAPGVAPVASQSSDALTLQSMAGLEIRASRAHFGTGDFAITGHERLSLLASETLDVAPGGSLQASGDLHIMATRLGSRATDDTREALGTRVLMQAAAIDFDGQASLASGGISVSADSRLQIGSRAVLDVSGRAITAGTQTHATGGGRVVLRLRQGDLSVDEGSRIDLRPGAAGLPAGALEVHSPGGTVDLAATILGGAEGGDLGAAFTLDAGHMDATAMGGLATRIGGAGFTRAVALRIREGDLRLSAGDRIDARDISLVADDGAIHLAGSLDASGPVGGRIVLAGGRGVTLAGTARVQATGSGVNARGGALTLSAIGASSAEAAEVLLAPGARIVLAGGEVGDQREEGPEGALIQRNARPTAVVDGMTRVGGQLRVRTLRELAGGGLTQAATLSGVGRAELEITSIRTLAGDVVIDADRLAAWRGETAATVAEVTAPDGFAVLPGLEVRTDGDLHLATTWDLSSWRTGGEAGALTLRAGGALTLAAPLTDGVAAATLQVGDATATVTRTLTQAIRSDRSWRFDLVAGADLGSADVRAVAAANDLTLAPGAFVRTGTGDIQVVAGGDLHLADDRSSIYTIGRRAVDSTTLGVDNPYGTLGRLITQFYAEYPVAGGDVRVQVGGDAIGAVASTSSFRVGTRNVVATTHQFLTDWYAKAGAGVGFTAWGIAIDLPAQMLTVQSSGVPIQNILNARSGFRQGLGALGGGNVEVQAGGNVRDLSAVVTTTGMPIGARANPAQSNNSPFLSRDVLVRGGGDLRIEAGGDLEGGLFFADGGVARIAAGGSLQGGTQFGSGPVLALGRSALDVHATGDIHLGAVFDPGMLTQVYSTAPASRSTHFFRGGDRASVRVTSLAGDVSLAQDVDLLRREAVRFVARSQGAGLVVEEQAYLANTEFLRVLPASLQVAALGGDLLLERSFSLFPGRGARLDLHADGDIATGHTGNAVIVNLLDADPIGFPSPLRPVGTFTAESVGVLEVFNRLGLSHAATPVHAGSREPVRVVTARGDIMANDRLILASGKRLELHAGRDLRNVDLSIQHANPEDISRISAGRDIRFDTRLDIATGDLLAADQEMLLGGGGRYVFTAGRDIDLGASRGIVSLGSTRNPALPREGASIALHAGFQPGVDWVGLADHLLREAPQTLLGAELAQSLGVMGEGIGMGDAGDAEALRRAYLALGPQGRGLLERALTDPRLEARLSRAFFARLRSAGLAGIDGRGYHEGEAAIAALFGPAARQGDIRLFFSRVQTVAGGDIDLLVPGGLVNAGLASTVLIQKPADELGIIVQAAGAVNAFVRDDFQVNASRVFALGGGDITIWSARGNIDAGRGAKAALSVPPPQVSFDANGNLRVEFPAAVSGSGIRTASSGLAGRAGDVYLFAPRGAIDAGEAGIGGDDIFVGGEVCLNCGNIDVGGAALGLPTVANVSVPVGLAAAGDAAANAAQNSARTTAAADSAAANQGSLAGRASPLLVSADLLGFGDFNITQIREGRHVPGASTAPRTGGVP